MREFANDSRCASIRRPSSSTSERGTPPSGCGLFRAVSSRERSCSSNSKGSATSSAARRPRATWVSGGARFLPCRSTPTRSGRSRMPFARPGTRCSRARSDSNGRSCKVRLSLAASATYRRWRTGQLRAEPIRRFSEWQVYRLLDVPRGAWTAFQYLVRERLREEGIEVLPDGKLA